MILATSTTEVHIPFALKTIVVLTVLLLLSPFLVYRYMLIPVAVAYAAIVMPLATIAFREWWVERTFGNGSLVSDDHLRYGGQIHGLVRTERKPPQGTTYVKARLFMSFADPETRRPIMWTVETTVAASERTRDEFGRVAIPFTLTLGGSPVRSGDDPNIQIIVRCGFWLTGFAGQFDLGPPLDLVEAPPPNPPAKSAPRPDLFHSV